MDTKKIARQKVARVESSSDTSGDVSSSASEESAFPELTLEIVKARLKKGHARMNMCPVCCEYTLYKTAQVAACVTCYKAGHTRPSPFYLELCGTKCKACNDRFIPKFEGCDMCTDCYNETKKFATPCPRCGENNILPGQEKKIMCTKCSSSDECKRKCETCGKKNIYGNSADWVKICSECMVNCVECDKKFTPYFKGSKVCTDCYKGLMEYARECSKCHKQNIMPTEDDSVQVCKGCREKRLCGVCGEAKILTKAPKYVKTCNDCEEAKAKAEGKGYKCPTVGCDQMIYSKWKKTCTSCWRNGAR